MGLAARKLLCRWQLEYTYVGPDMFWGRSKELEVSLKSSFSKIWSVYIRHRMLNKTWFLASSKPSKANWTRNSPLANQCELVSWHGIHSFLGIQLRWWTKTYDGRNRNTNSRRLNTFYRNSFSLIVCIHCIVFKYSTKGTKLRYSRYNTWVYYLDVFTVFEFSPFA